MTLWLLPAPLPGAGAAPDSDAAPKPYHLFLGADISAQWQGQLHPVVGVQRNALVIEAEGQRVRVTDRGLQMKIFDALKLTTAFATVAEVKAERAYTAANDPRHQVREAMLSADESSANAALAVMNLNSLQSTYNEEHSAAHLGMRELTPSFTVSADDLAQASSVMNRSFGSMDREGNSVADAAGREQAELDRKLFDAFTLSFAISARPPLDDPYLVVMVRFREASNDPKTARLMVCGEVLSPVGEQPQAVRLFRGGFPRGYQLEGYQIHVYDHGVEVATSAAPKQMALTRSEAFQFSIADYAGRNREQSLPPAPARAFWPRNLADRLPVKNLDRPLYLRVGKDGLVAGFYDDAGCTRPVSDAELESVRPDLHFFPALQKGKPVEGTVVFNLGQRVD